LTDLKRVFHNTHYYYILSEEIEQTIALTLISSNVNQKYGQIHIKLNTMLNHFLAGFYVD